MSFRTLRIIGEETAGVTIAEEIDAIYMDGFMIGDGALDNIAFRITTHDGKLACKVPKKAVEALGTDAYEIARRCLDAARECDAFFTSPYMTEETGILYDDEKPAEAQTFLAAPTFTIISAR